MAQFGRPSADVSSGPWLPSTSTTLFGVIDEVSPDDEDFAYTTTTGLFQVGLSSVTDPATSTGHVVRFRMSGDTSTTGVVTLYDTTNSSAISTFTVTSVPAAASTYSFTLTGAAADSISSYANLRFWFNASSAGGAPPAFVQNSTTPVQFASANSINVDISSVAAGNALIFALGCLATSVSISTITGGPTFTSTGSVITGSGGSIQVWYATNVSASSYTLTCTLSDSATYRVATVHEVSGLATSSTLDVYGGASDPLNTGNVTTTAIDDYIFAANYTGDGSTAYIAGSTYTLRATAVHADGISHATEDKVQATASTINATFATGPSTGCSVLVAFKKA